MSRLAKSLSSKRYGLGTANVDMLSIEEVLEALRQFDAGILMRNTLFLLSHQIAHPADGMDQYPCAVLAELLAKARYINLHSVGSDIAREAENMVFDVLLWHHPSLPSQQDFQYGSFARGKYSGHTVDEYLPALGVIDEVGEVQRTAQQLARTAQDRLQSRHQFFQSQRLCQVVIRPTAQTAAD